MRDELDRRLVSKYPEIFRDRYGSPLETLMCWGFECNDGWYGLIDSLCQRLTNKAYYARTRYENLIKWKQDGGTFPWKGGREITDDDVAEYKAKMEAELAKIPVAVQVKEKFGTLRFYTGPATDEHRIIIDTYESLSSRVCEQCGSMDETVRTWPLGWHQTLCEQHACQNYSAQTVLEFYMREKDENA